MSRSPFTNRFPGVTYHIGDITKVEHVKSVMEQVRPRVVFNTASPHAYVDHVHAGDNFSVNVEGMRNLLDVAGGMGGKDGVRAVVYTSKWGLRGGVLGVGDLWKGDC